MVSYGVAISVFSLGGWRKRRGGCVRKIGHKYDSCEAQKAENTDPRTNYGAKHATARCHLRLSSGCHAIEASHEIGSQIAKYHSFRNH